jgi:3-oxoadipate enol-lactonase
VPEKYVQVDAIATFLRHRGATTLPEVPPRTDQGELALLLHGTGGNSGELDALCDRLACSHSPLAFDFPAHGRSAGIDSLTSVEAMADFTQGLVAKLGLRPAVLVGHSLGGLVALDYALRQPDAVRGLVLVGAGARADVPTETLERWRRVSEGKEQRRLRVELFAKGTAREVFQRAFMEFIKTDPRALYGDLAAIAGWSVGERAAGLRVPLLCVVGEHESDATVAAVDELVAAAPDARKQVVPAAARQIPLEQPDALGDVVLEFLQGLGS